MEGTVKSMNVFGDEVGGSERSDEDGCSSCCLLLERVKALRFDLFDDGEGEPLVPTADLEETEMAATSIRLALTSSFRQDRKMSAHRKGC